MRVSYGLAISVLAVCLCACNETEEGRLPTIQPTMEQLHGTWGNEGVRLVIGDSSSTMEVHCGVYTIYGAFLVVDGAFDLPGKLDVLVAPSPGTGLEARFYGEVSAGSMSMTVRFSRPEWEPREYTLQEGVIGTIGGFPCV